MAVQLLTQKKGVGIQDTRSCRFTGRKFYVHNTGKPIISTFFMVIIKELCCLNSARVSPFATYIPRIEAVLFLNNTHDRVLCTLNLYPVNLQ